jgi:hypothetical protein
MTINGEAGHDLGVEVVEEVGEAGEETQRIMKVPLASIFWYAKTRIFFRVKRRKQGAEDYRRDACSDG